MKNAMRNVQRLILADDLTGATDTGVHFLADDQEVLVIVDPERESSGLLPQTVIINTNTRLCTKEKAYDAVCRSIRKYLQNESLEIYKKIDSTLRGNIGAEIDAVMDLGNYPIACISPASPRNGRTVIQGKCYVHGILLHQTEVGQDSLTPVRDSNVINIIAQQSSRSIGLIPLEVIRRTPEDALLILQELIQSGKQIIVADAETIDDLRRTRELFQKIPERVLFVGSAGIFHASRQKLLTYRTTQLVPIKPRAKILIVAGSLTEVTLSQIKSLRENLFSRACYLATEQALLDSDTEADRLANNITSAFSYANLVILQSDRMNAKSALAAYEVGTTLGKVVSRITKKIHIDVLIVTGGDTAQNILKYLCVQTLSLFDEVLPGIPISEIHLPIYSCPTLFITKAGSYGNRNAFNIILDYLSSPKRIVNENII